MANKRTKHFKSIRKEPEIIYPDGIFISEEYKWPVIMAGVALSIVLFINGIVLGYFMNRNND